MPISFDAYPSPSSLVIMLKISFVLDGWQINRGDAAQVAKLLIRDSVNDC